MGKNNKKTGVTFSAFDFIHPGHIAMLKDAKSQCDYLIVGIQTDPTLDAEYRAKQAQRINRYTQWTSALA